MSSSPSWTGDSESVTKVAVISIFCFFAILAVGLRLWARRIQRIVLDPSDYLCLTGLFFSLVLSFYTINSTVNWYLGGTQSQLGDPNAMMKYIELQGKSALIGTVLWLVAVFFLRASILYLYMIIFRTKSFRTACWTMQGINAAFFVSTTIADCVVCQPVSAMWNPSSGNCGNLKGLDMFIGIFNIFLDIGVVVMPMPVLWRLQMNTAKKIVLSLIFGMGIVICIITIIRVWTTSQIGPGNEHNIYSLIALYSIIEALLGVINTCLPVIRPVFTRFSNSALWKSWSLGSHHRSFPGRYSGKESSASNSGSQKPNNLRHENNLRVKGDMYGPNNAHNGGWWWKKSCDPDHGIEKSSFSTVSTSSIGKSQMPSRPFWAMTQSPPPSSTTHKLNWPWKKKRSMKKASEPTALPRYVTPKAAKIMFSTQHNQNLDPAGVKMNPPRPPPKSPYYIPGTPVAWDNRVPVDRNDDLSESKQDPLPERKDVIAENVTAASSPLASPLSPISPIAHQAMTGRSVTVKVVPVLTPRGTSPKARASPEGSQTTKAEDCRLNTESEEGRTSQSEGDDMVELVIKPHDEEMALDFAAVPSPQRWQQQQQRHERRAGRADLSAPVVDRRAAAAAAAEYQNQGW